LLRYVDLILTEDGSRMTPGVRRLDAAFVSGANNQTTRLQSSVKPPHSKSAREDNECESHNSKAA